MKNLTTFWILKTLALFTFSISTLTVWAAPQPRPPQFVLLAFDGSLNLSMWDETLKFAKTNNVKLTYFLSGVYFLLDSNKKDYIEPTKGAGISAIGFAGDSKKDLIARVDYVNKAYDSGHTIGSHANGHFDQSLWTMSEWELEFQEFSHLIFDVYTQKGFGPIPNLPKNPYHFSPDQISGFRAPLLATNSGLYQILRKNKFQFDTSQTDEMDYWPVKTRELWNFPLAEVRIYGTGKPTLSMDYNFYYTQSGGNPDLKNAEVYRNQMYQTYMGYFYTNYYGNRAPVHIGHHFSQWNGGAYWRALLDFTKTVCKMPEVKCVSYHSLLKFMNSLSPEQIAEYQLGNFPKLPIPPKAKKDILAVAPIDVHFNMQQISEQELALNITGKDAHLFPKDSLYIWKLDNKEIFRSTKPKINFSRITKRQKIDIAKLTALLEFKGTELLRTSHIINVDDETGFSLDLEDLEKRSSLGDLPEAHKTFN